jgi:hypothetical protein
VYQIIARYENALVQVGRVIGDLVEKTHDTRRMIPIRKPSGDQDIVQINAPYDRKMGEKGPTKRVHYPITPGGFSYTYSTGPSYQSQFEEASDFVNSLLQSVPELLWDGKGQTILGDLLIKLKNLGPIGDELVDRFKKILDPRIAENTEIPPQAQAELQKGQTVINALTAKLQEYQKLIDSKTLEYASEERRNEQDNKTKIAVAEINASVKENVAQLQETMKAIGIQMNQTYEMMQNGPQLPGTGSPDASAPSGAPEQAPAPEPQEAPLQPTHTFDPNSQEVSPVVGQPQ